MGRERRQVRHERLSRALALHMLDFAGWDQSARTAVVTEVADALMRRGFWRLSADRAGLGESVLFGDELIDTYLGYAEVGAICGVSAKVAMNYALPRPDAQVGARPGWHASTIIKWNATRPRRPTAAERAAVVAAERAREGHVQVVGEAGADSVWLEAFFEALGD